MDLCPDSASSQLKIGTFASSRNRLKIRVIRG
jgi:hypothetical protein